MKKHIFPLVLLLSWQHLSHADADRCPFLSHMQRAQQGFRSNIRQMQEEMNHFFEAFDSLFDDADRAPQEHAERGPSLHEVEHDETSCTLALSDVAQGDIQASFNDDTLQITHPAFQVIIAKGQQAYHKGLLFVQLQAEQKSATEDEGNKMTHAWFSSQTQSVRPEKAVDLEKTVVKYDDTAKRLLIQIPYHATKQIPVLQVNNAMPEADA